MSGNNNKRAFDKWRSQLLSPTEMLELARTEEGKRELFKYIVSARVGYAMQAVFEQLNVVPEAEVQIRCCEIIWDTIFRVPIENVLYWASEAAKSLDDNDIAGSC